MIQPPQYVTVGLGGRVGVYLTDRPAVAPTVQFYDAAGVALMAAAATTTQETATTTISSAAAAGDITLAVTAATGIRAGQDLELAPATVGTATSPGETVRVESVASLVVTLARRLLYAHPSGTPLRSTACYYEATSANVGSTPTRNARAEFSWTDSEAKAQITVVRLAISRRRFEQWRLRRYVRSKANEQSLWDRYGALDLLVPAQCDVRAVIDAAEEQVMSALEPRFDSRQFIGCDLLEDPTAWLALAMLWDANPGSAGGVNPFASRAEQAILSVAEIGATDTNDDGAVDTRPAQRHDLAGAG